MSKHGMRRRGQARPITWQQLAQATGLNRRAIQQLPPGQQPPATRPRTLADYARLAAGEPKARKRRPVPLEKKGHREVMIRQDLAQAGPPTPSLPASAKA
jgi:transcriptional regulator with XRE-family HTH domain